MTLAFIEDKLCYHLLIFSPRFDLLLGKECIPIGKPELFDGMIALGAYRVVSAGDLMTIATSEDAGRAGQTA
jgi:hypothetical protein